MRGKVHHTSNIYLFCRITPACAGKSSREQYYLSVLQDHPRMCGEKSGAFSWLTPGMGSPPHVRGKGNDKFICNCHNRITPACAGKSPLRTVSTNLKWDHPRMCGEKYSFMVSYVRKSGSPPHVRGKDKCICSKCHKIRITPACAGKSIVYSYKSYSN